MRRCQPALTMEKAMNAEIRTASIRLIPVDSEDPELLASNMTQWRINFRPRTWCPATDLIEMTDRLIIRLEIAGMRQSDFAIWIEPKRIRICGHRSEILEQRCFHRMEIPFGDFESEVDLPQPIDVHQTVAEYRDGFLSITLPKVEQTTPQDQNNTTG
jgi:HSP20 family protein